MKRPTIILLGEVSALYLVIIIVIRGFLLTNVNVPFYILAAPFLVVVLALALDLSGRATEPSESAARNRPSRKLGRGIERMAKQIEVAKSASPGYYDTVLLSRLRDALVEKISLETGMDREQTRESLKSKNLGPRLLHNPELYSLLYSGPRSSGEGLLADLERTIRLIEAWKP